MCMFNIAMIANVKKNKVPLIKKTPMNKRSSATNIGFRDHAKIPLVTSSPGVFTSKAYAP